MLPPGLRRALVFFHFFGIIRRRNALLILSVIGLLMSGLAEENKFTLQPIIANVFVLVGAYSILGVLNWRGRKSNRPPSFSQLARTFILFLAAIWVFDHIILARFAIHIPILAERLLFPLSIFWLEATAFENPIPMFTWDQFLNFITPSNCLVAVPIEQWRFNISEEREKLRRIRFQGLVDFIVAAVLTFAYFQLQRVIDSHVDGHSIWLAVGLLGALFYLQLYFKSMWIFRLVTGVGRTIGFDLKDGFHYAILAASPVERWTPLVDLL